MQFNHANLAVADVTAAAEFFQRHCLGAGHIRFEPTHEDDAGSASFRAPIGYGGVITHQGIFL